MELKLVSIDASHQYASIGMHYNLYPIKIEITSSKKRNFNFSTKNLRAFRTFAAKMEFFYGPSCGCVRSHKPPKYIKMTVETCSFRKCFQLASIIWKMRPKMWLFKMLRKKLDEKNRVNFEWICRFNFLYFWDFLARLSKVPISCFISFLQILDIF